MNPIQASRLFRHRIPSQCACALRQSASQRPTTFLQRRSKLHNQFSTGSSPRSSRYREPLDTSVLDRNQQNRQQFVKRQLRLGIAAAVCMAVIPLIMYLNPMPEKENKTDGARLGDRMDAKENETFQGRPVVVAAGGQKLVAQDPNTHDEIELVPTGTSYVPHFPKTINIPSEGVTEKDSEYTLIGLGIRKVSFLGVQVYVVGFYVKNSALAAFQSSLIHQINPNASALILGEKQKLETALLDPEESQRIWDSLLQDKSAGLTTVFRIVPVRDTNFNHLRDGWVTGITNRIQEASQKRQKLLKEATQNGQGAVVAPPEFDDEAMGLAMRNFKALFSGRGKAPKGSIILLERSTSGTLDAYFQKSPTKGDLEKIGTVDDERVSRLIWLLYLGGKNVSSEDARKDVVKGVIEIAERPVGTVETMVS